MARTPFVLAALTLTAAVAVTTSSHAAAPKAPKAPKAPAVRPHEELAANPYFVQDENDPRVLRTSPEFAQHGFDRGYIERMARPHISSSVLDAQAALTSKRPTMIARPESLPPINAGTISGRVIVLDGSGLVINGQQGQQFDHQGNGLQNAVEAVFQQLGDQFDFITVFTTFDDATTAAYYLPLRQDTLGLGKCDFQSGETFGCQFNQLGPDTKLQGFVFMNSLATWQDWDRNTDGFVHDFSDPTASIYAVLGQEHAHRWGSGLRFVDPRTGTVSEKLLGRDNSHWAAFVDTDASVMDGWDWSPPDAHGNYTLLNDMASYSSLDLYAMGALAVGQAKPFFFIDNAKYITNGQVGLNGRAIGKADVLELGLPSVAFLKQQGITIQASGERVDLSIGDVVNAEGLRCPDADHTQKTFRQAIVLVTKPGEGVNSAGVNADVAELETVIDTWEQWWSDRTHHALAICAELDAECTQPVATLGGGALDKDAAPGGSSTLNVKVSVEQATLKGAHLDIVLDGNGAPSVTLAQPTVDLGDIAGADFKNVQIPLTFAKDYGCGLSTIVRVTLRSDNAADITEEYRLFPGYKSLFTATFDDGDDGFVVNKDGKDGATSGALERDQISLSCDMTTRTPERDASPDGLSAFVTGSSSELSGDTTLWSPALSIKDTLDPEVRFAYWLDGQPGDTLKVELSGDGKTFVVAQTYTDSFHGWVLGRARVRDVFKTGALPERVTARFLFTGAGKVEGGIDDVRLLDFAGSCTAVARVPGCSSTDDTHGNALAGVLAVVTLGVLGRRRRRA